MPGSGQKHVLGAGSAPGVVPTPRPPADDPSVGLEALGQHHAVLVRLCCFGSRLIGRSVLGLQHGAGSWEASPGMGNVCAMQDAFAAQNKGK